MKRGLFIIGVGLLGLAFIAGAAEIAAQGVKGELRVYMSVAEVWQVLSPDSLEKSRIDGVTRFGELWNLSELLMLLPGWLLFGVPGFAMAYFFRDRDAGPDSEHEESVFLYDELAKQAKNEGMHDPIHGDDVMPSSHIKTEPAEPKLADENIDTEELQAPHDEEIK